MNKDTVKSSAIRQRFYYIYHICLEKKVDFDKFARIGNIRFFWLVSLK